MSTTSTPIEVPDWQRSYSWEASQVEAFWQDLCAFSDRYGGLTIDREEYFLGSIVLVTGGSRSLLLDGQQRLVTATILLAALRDSRRAYNADAASRLQHRYIADFDDATGATSYVLTLNLYDREFFRREVQDETAVNGSPVARLKSHGLVRKARHYFQRQIAEEWERRGGGERAFLWNCRISNVLLNHMSVVAVTSTDEDNAAEVFETLNDRGLGLSTPDLLRNLLLRRAGSEESRERIVAAWQEILAMSEEASIDEFLRHYWVSCWGDVKSRKLYSEIKGAVVSDNVDPFRLSLDLADASAVYREIVKARHPDPDVQRCLQIIRELGAKALYPLLLSGQAVADREGSHRRLLDLARALITMFVRYNVIGGRETTVMETAIYNAAAELRKTGDFDAAIASVYALATDARTFVRQFMTRSITRAATARYVLRAIEHAMRRTAEVVLEAPDRVHLEHIYPQTPSGAAWSSHASLVNRLGNLTLLGKRFNTSIRNGSFEMKKTAAYSSSDIRMTQALMSYDEWTPETVDQRQRELSTWILEIWPVPGDVPVELTALDGADDLASDEDSELDQLPEVPTG